MCYELKAEDKHNLQKVVNTFTKALILINTDESYQLKESISGVKEVNMPIIIVTKSDGSTLLNKISNEDYIEAFIDDGDMVDDMYLVHNHYESPRTIAKFSRNGEFIVLLCTYSL